MMFVKVQRQQEQGQELDVLYLNVSRIDAVRAWDKMHARIDAGGVMYFASIEGFGSLENFIQLLGEDPEDVEVEA